MLNEQDELASLLDDFISECAEHLTAAEERLLRLEATPGDATLAREMLRSFHTIKGNSAYFDFREMAELAHKLESLLTPVQEGLIPLTADGMQTLLGGVDRLRELLREISDGRRAQAVSGPESLAEVAGAEEEAAEERFLLFELNGTRMALPLVQVLEVTRPVAVAPLPHVPSYVVGLVNLRGNVVPLLDLGCKLWGEPAVSQAQHLIVVPAGRGRVALAVGRVAEVASLDFVGEVGLHRGMPVAMLDLAQALSRADGGMGHGSVA